MVSFFAGEEYLEAARWLVFALWTVIHGAHPRPRLRLVGSDPRNGLDPIQNGVDNVARKSFVVDLWSGCQRTTVSVMPIHHGAGVKFKRIESLIAGAPLIAASVGADGIGDAEAITDGVDDAVDFSRVVIEVLNDPAATQRKALQERDEALTIHGQDAFEKRVSAVHLERGTRA